MVNQRIEIDCLTNHRINPEDIILNPEKDFFEYYCKPVGVVKISASAYVELSSEIHKEDRLKLAGICRYAYERKEAPPFILITSLDNIFQKNDIPKNFGEKRVKLLEYLIFKGGNEYKEVDLVTEYDFPLVYGDSDEFRRVVISLIDDDFIHVKAPNKDGFHRSIIKKEGVKFVEDSQLRGMKLKELFLDNEIAEIISMITSAEYEKALSLMEEILAKRGNKVGLRILQGLTMQYNNSKNNRLRGVISQEERDVRITRIFFNLIDQLN